ncbi:MAG: DMT family transporter [Pseudomonadota bacterium]
MTDNIKGAGLMTLSMLTFAINDAFIKSLGGVVPVFQTLTLRTGMTLVLLCIYVSVTGWSVGPTTWREKGLIGLRTLSEIGAAYFIVTALFHMPLANITAILQMLPLSVPLAALIVLREPLGWQRLAAIAVGFLGMLLIVQPGAGGFTDYSLYGVAAVICVTIRDITARSLRAQISPGVLSVFVACGVFVFSGAMALTEPFVPVPPQGWIGLIGSAVAIMVGYIVSVSAIRHGDVSFTAQFRYTGLLAALVLGYVFFGEWPNALTLLGACIVVCMGLFTLYRERQVRMITQPVDSSGDSP